MLHYNAYTLNEEYSHWVQHWFSRIGLFGNLDTLDCKNVDTQKHKP